MGSEEDVNSEAYRHKYDNTTYYLTAQEFEQIFYGLNLDFIKRITTEVKTKALARELSSNKISTRIPGVYEPGSPMSSVGGEGLKALIEGNVHITPGKYPPVHGTLSNYDDTGESWNYTLKLLYKSIFLARCTFKDDVVIENIKLNQPLYFLDCVFEKQLKFINCKFKEIIFESSSPGQQV